MKKILLILAILLAAAGDGFADEKLSSVQEEITLEVSAKTTQSYADGREKERTYYINNKEITKVITDAKGKKKLEYVDFEKNRDRIVKVFFRTQEDWNKSDSKTWEIYTACLTVLKEYTVLRSDKQALKAIIEYSASVDAAAAEVMSGILSEISFKDPAMFLEILSQVDDKTISNIIENLISVGVFDRTNGALVDININKDEFIKKYARYVNTVTGKPHDLGKKLLEKLNKE